MASRPSKTLRLTFVERDARGNAYVQVLGQPAEVRIASSDRTFISVRDDGLTLSPGYGGNINIQALPQNVRYAGMLMDLPFPMSVLPVTPFTPFPHQVVMPPLAKIVPLLADLSLIASSLVV